MVSHWLRSLNNNVTSGFKKSAGKSPAEKQPSGSTWLGRCGLTMFVDAGHGCGNALMGIIKWLEDRREQNAAKWIDDVLGTSAARA